MQAIASITTRAALLLLLCANLANGADALDPAKDFQQPPPAARPWVYWFVLDGNLTKEGITADFEAMARVGIGGVLYMEVAQGTPVGKASFAGPLWMEMFSHACKEAKRLGLEINMNNDAGWNGSGGPWITPEMSMQVVVWSETMVDATNQSPVELPQPKAEKDYYQDIAVFAMPAPTVDARIPNIIHKSSAATRGIIWTKDTPLAANDIKEVPAGAIIPRDQVIDISSKMDRDGKLSWTPPAGKWLVMRFGHTTTGTENHPAPASGRGLECDKLSKAATTLFFNSHMGKIVQQNKQLTGQDQALVAVHIDSWEIGTQNWTPLMREEFRKRRGYDMLPLLPVFSGRVIGSTEISERFLWDLRQTVSDLIVENYAGTFRKLAHQHGLRLTIEAYNGPADDMAYAGQSDEPMGEFWQWPKFVLAETCTEMASAAHTYGKQIVGAEAFTSRDTERWLSHPGNIKDTGDWAFCEGINRFVFHRYAAQPWTNAAPGVSMGPWGLHYERTQTWWEQSKAWHEYLARCQSILQQGKFVADIAYLTPEGTPRQFIAPPEAEIAPQIRSGYGFDGCSADVVLNRMTVKDGRIVLPDGMNYRALVLPEVPTMTPPLLAKIKAMADAGAMIVGSVKPPQKSPSLADMGAGDEQVRTTAAALWASGKILHGKTAQQFLAERGVAPDFSALLPLRWIHRRLDEGTDVYFVANPSADGVVTTATFRVSGRQPELWWPDSGRMETAIAFHEGKDVTNVHLNLEPHGSVFVVFRKPSADIDPVVTLQQGGKNLWSLIDPVVADLSIKQATYGIPGDAQRSLDVTAKVQGLVAAGAKTLFTSQLGITSDPAPGVIKTLSIVCVDRGVERIVTGTDVQPAYLSTPKTRVKIIHATYGVPGDAQRSRDVTRQLQNIANQGKVEFTVGELAVEGDPAGGVIKTLVAEVEVNGVTTTITGTDPDYVRLAAAQKYHMPVATVTAGADGGVRLLARQPGSYAWITASGKTFTHTIPAMPELEKISDSWQVTFDPAKGGPGTVSFAKLEDWAKRPEDGIKYYSGTAVYQTTFTGVALKANQRVELDLGEVEVNAEVTLNGKALGILWKRPFRVDVTDALKTGENNLLIHVTNLWVNRQIGDEHLPEDSERNANGTLKSWPEWVMKEQPSPTGRHSFTSWRRWSKDDPLVTSGLLGPVTLQTSEYFQAN